MNPVDSAEYLQSGKLPYVMGKVGMLKWRGGEGARRKQSCGDCVSDGKSVRGFR